MVTSSPTMSQQADSIFGTQNRGGDPIGNLSRKEEDEIMETREMADKAQEWQERAQDLTDQARNWQRKATDTARRTGQAVQDYVSDNTWMSVAIAAAVGCAIGMLFMRSRD